MKNCHFQKIYLTAVFIILIGYGFVSGLQIKGKALNRQTKDPVQSGFAILKQGTNFIESIPLENDGSFLLEDVNKGNYTIEIRSIGFYIESRNIIMEKNANLYFYLLPQGSTSMGEVEVVGERDKGSVSKDVITKETREKAVTSITGDPVSTFLKMPGVDTISGGFGRGRGSTGFSVRGGSGFENLALMDGTLIIHPYHTLFPDSVFIDDLVKEMTLYKGVIPPQYGQALSSLLDVKLEDGKEGFHGKVNVGLLNTYLTLNGATKDGKWSFIGGIRRTQYDLEGMLLLNFTQPGINTSTISLPYYLDSQGKIQYKENNDLVQLIWHYSDEPTKIYIVATNPNPANNSGTQVLTASAVSYNPDGILNLHWKHSFNESLSLEQFLQGTYSLSYQGFYFTNNTTNMISSFQQTSENNIRYKTLANINILPNSILRPGAEIIYYPDLQATNVFYLLYTNQTTKQIETRPLIDSGYDGKLGIYAAFLENETYFFDNRVVVLGGLRANYVDFVNKTSLDPRITLQYEFIPGDKIYGAWGYISEFPTDPTTIAVISSNNNNIDIPGCYHYVLGNKWQILPASSLTIEGYFKDYRNLVTEDTNFQLTYKTTGKQRKIYGYEVFWTQKPENFPVYGWIGLGGYVIWEYKDVNRITGISRNTALPPTNEWYIGDNGVDYKLDITAIWDINKNWSITGEFNWKAGLHYTPITGATSQIQGTNTIYYPVFGTYNSAKLPDYHTLNLKVENRGELFHIPYGLYLEVQNVYNDLQVNGYSYSSDYATKTEQKAFFGIIPSIGFWMEW